MAYASTSHYEDEWDPKSPEVKEEDEITLHANDSPFNSDDEANVWSKSTSNVQNEHKFTKPAEWVIDKNYGKEFNTIEALQTEPKGQDLIIDEVPIELIQGKKFTAGRNTLPNGDKKEKPKRNPIPTLTRRPYNVLEVNLTHVPSLCGKGCFSTSCHCHEFQQNKKGSERNKVTL